MIDLHTHSLLSDGCLLPSELARRAQVAGCKAIAITDHVDHSNVDMVITGLTRVADVLNRYWDIFVIPGVEITHVPVEVFPELAAYCRQKGARVVVGHGESPVEPVLPGTNRAAIEAGVDILAHPGFISDADAAFAAQKGVYLEITARKGHSETNGHVLDTAMKNGALMVLNTDGHAPDDLLTLEKRAGILDGLADRDEIKAGILRNSEDILDRIRKA